MKKKLLGCLLGFSLLIANSVLPVCAATISVSLDSTKTTVTTKYSDCRGSTVVYVSGYEIHSTTSHEVLYNKSKSTTESGEVTFKHNTDAGYKFQTYYNGVYLTSKIIVSGVQVGENKVN